MKINDFLKIKSLKCLYAVENDHREISNFYVGDMLSWVMGHVREENVCLITVLNSVNVIAVAVMLEMPIVIFCDGTKPSDEVIKKAKEENINIFCTDKNSFNISKEIIEYESFL